MTDRQRATYIRPATKYTRPNPPQGTCRRCGENYPKHAPNQKYCDKCSPDIKYKGRG